MSEINDGPLSIGLNIDTSGVDQGLDHVESRTVEAVNKVVSESTKIQNALKNIGSIGSNKDLLSDIGITVEQVGTKLENALIKPLSSSEAQSALEQIKGAFADIEKVVTINSEAVTTLQRAYDSLGDKAARASMKGTQAGKQEANQYKKQQLTLKEEIRIRKDLISQAKQQEKVLKKNETTIKENSQAHQTLRTRIRDLENEAALLRDQYQQEGKTLDESSGRYKEIIDELGRLKDIRGDLQKQGQILSNDQGQFQGIISGVTGITGGFMAAQAAMSMFSSEDKELQEVMVKVNQLMTITMGLQQMSNMLNKDSAFMLKTVTSLKKVWLKLTGQGKVAIQAEATAIRQSTIAQTANAGATKAAGAAIKGNIADIQGQAAAAQGSTVAIKGTTVAAKGLKKALISTGIGALIVLIGVIIDKIMTAISASKKAKKEAAAAEADIAKSGAEAYAKAMFELDEYKRKIDKFNGSKLQEKKLIGEINSKYGASLGYYKTLAEQKHNLITKGQAYCRVLMQEAIAEAYKQKVVDNVVKNQELESKKKSGEYTRSWINPWRWFGSKYTNEYRNEKNNIFTSTDTFLKGYYDASKKADEIKTDNGLNTNGYTDPAEIEAAIKAQNAYKAAISKNNEEQARAVEDMLYKIRQAEINTWKEGTEKTIAQIELDFGKQQLAIQRGYEDLKKAKIAKAKELFEANPDNKDKIFNPNSVNTEPTKKEKDYYNALDKENEHNHAESLKKIAEQDQQAMWNYLKQYGTLQQQKLALEQEYAKKIEEARTAGEKMSLQEDLKKKEASLNAKSLAMNIDWGATFEGVGTVLQDIAKDALKKVEEYMRTAEFKALAPESKKAYTDLRDKLTKEAGSGSNPLSKKTWQVVADDTRAYQNAVKQATEANERHTQAVNWLKSATEQLEKANKDVTAATNKEEKAKAEAAKKWAESNQNMAKAAVNKTATDVTEANQEVDDSKNKLGDSSKKAVVGLDTFTAALNNISSGSLYGFANGLGTLIGALSKTGDATKGIGNLFGEAGKAVGGLIGAILQILDAMGDDPKQFMVDVTNKLKDAINNLIEQLPDILIESFKQFGEVAAELFGSITKMFGIKVFQGADYSPWKKALEYWGDRLEIWGEAVDRYTNAITESYGAKSYDAANKAKYYNEQEIFGQKALMEARLKSGKSVGSHSQEYRMWQGSYKSVLGRRWQDVAGEISNQYGTPFNSMADLMNFSADDLRDIKAQYADLWAALDEEFKKGLEDLIEMKDKAGEIKDSLKEALTGTDFDGFRDGFFDTLSDMSKGVDDLTKDFSEQLNKSILNSLLDKKFSERIKALYDQWAGIFNENGDVDAGLADNAKKVQEQLAQDMVAFRDSIATQFGLEDTTSDREASQKGIATASQDSVDELNGRATAIQGHTYSICENTKILLSTTQGILKSVMHIEGETDGLGKRMESVENSLKSVKEDINVIATKGINIKRA